MPRRIQLVVDHFNNQTRYYTVVVGRGVPRTLIPLDTANEAWEPADG